MSRQMGRGGGQKTFGLTSNGGGRSNVARQRGSFRRRGGHTGSSSYRGPGGNQKQQAVAAASVSMLKGVDDGSALEERFEQVKVKDEIDERLGFQRLEEGQSQEAWLVNMHPTLIRDEDHPTGRSGVDFYFIQDDASMFKATVVYQPYFFIGCRPGTESVVEEWVLRRYEGLVQTITREKKEDLKLPNHLVGHQRLYLKLNFLNVNDLLAVRRELLPLALEAQKKLSAVDTYADVLNSAAAEVEIGIEDSNLAYDAEADGWTGGKQSRSRYQGLEPSECINDIREYDVPYYLRVAIDNQIRVGLWYRVSFTDGVVSLEGVPDRVKRADPVVMAFDIETTKQPLKFPDAETDVVMMISYMVDGQGYLITNREIVSEDIEDFEYTPKEEYEGPFIIFNEPDEEAVLRRFFSHVQEVRPTVMATYNGDSFDFPFIETRAKAHGISMMNEIGFERDQENEFKSRSCAHLDCFRWVKRDSYLPQGSQGLKAVTVAKLGYDPMELDPELMTPYAIEQPQTLAQYSVSDAVATYYLYMKYVHPFIFSLCNIIPLNPDEVLRKGSGTLCETLLMVQAYKNNIIMPNRHEDPVGNTYKGHLLESETYVGGHVEALEAGVFRSDIETDFKVEPAAVQQLIDDLDDALEFSIIEEGKLKLEDVTNYAEVKAQIQSALEIMRDNPLRRDRPLIYHLDVAAMYPNIMLSNRLQPDSVVSEAMCATCDYNRPGMKCDKRMDWAWRGEYFPAKRDEVNMIKNALENESFPPKYQGGPRRRFIDLGEAERTALLHKRLGDYSRKVYKKTHESKTVVREAIICQRENPFYIDTVRDFRDRRYEYKGLHKTWKKNLDKANGGGVLTEVIEAKKMIVLYDSLQLAHKCILNSFYGYVMRKGARWYSMEMAGITCLTGATIIQMAKDLVDRIGRPLELDTDGIWCMLPGVFPEDFKFQCKDGKKFGISYPCTMLNHLVHKRFTNHQYHDLVDKETGRYEVHSENSIFFELDGPYRAMILPSSKEEDKLLKKRYAVFEHDGSLAELKGFEVKRRGELQLIKDFQKQIFEKFLLGNTLEECYAAVAKVADQWLDVLYSKGSTLHDQELIDLIAENKSMSRTLQEYGSQKSTAITTAKRLAEFLGAQMIKDKGLACKFIVSAKPFGAPVTERAVPVAIFNAEESIKKHYLKKFLKDQSLTDFDLRSILDWDYYIERFGGVIQKLITIPAAMQKVSNPVPRVRHPDWLFKRVAAREDKFKQRKLTDVFKASKAGLGPTAKALAKPVVDDESIATVDGADDGGAQIAAEVEVVPDMNQDYPGWVRVMKKKWRKAREQRAKERKSMASTNGGIRTGFQGASGTVGSLFSKRSMSMATATWDLVQICPTSRIGEYRMWISIDSQLQSLKLKVPREFYINFKKLPRPGTFLERYKVESVVRTLPRGTACRHLFKITVDEATFTEEEFHFSALINHPNVDGVYEMQVPLDVRALIKLGSTCAMDQTSGTKLSKALDTGFELSDLLHVKPSVISRHRYLGGGKGFRHFYLYHANKDSRHVLGLFTSDGEAKVHIIDTAGLRQVPNLETLYADRVSNMKKKGRLVPGEGAFNYTDKTQFEVRVHNDEAKAFRALGRDLGNMRNAKRGWSTILSICSSKDQAYYESRMSSVIEFPMVSIPAARVDDDLPALGWQLYSVRRMVNSYLRTSLWLSRWMELANHFDLPLCNIERDFSMFGADVDFSRRLIKQDMVLWWSDKPSPDLGGREDDINSLTRWDDVDGVEISHPGCYSDVVLEVGLTDLAVDSVLQSGSVNDVEGAGGAGSMAFDTSSHNLDEYSKGTVESSTVLGDSVLTSQVFTSVKSMVKSWYIDKARARSPYSPLLSDNFWRWASNPSSRMFEPALQRFLYGLMRKTLLQLLAEFKRLGANIVYASFNRLFLLTSKPTAGSAAAYAKYLMSAVTARELFKHVSLDIVHYWEYLVWMDTANFGGVCSEPERDLGAADFSVEMSWNIQTFLPPALQERFSNIVGSFIYQLYEAKRRSALESGGFERTPMKLVQAEALEEGGQGGLASGTDLKPIDPTKAKLIKQGKDLINHGLTRKLLKLVQEIKGELSESKLQVQSALSAAKASEEEEDWSEYEAIQASHSERWSFPSLPGMHTKPTNATLEFVKSVTAVIALCKETRIEAQILKRNLLDLIGVREFSTEAEWRNPCEAFRLPLVICQFCNDDRTLDLCRDADLMPEVVGGGAKGRSGGVGSNKVKEWRCSKCDFPYDRSWIEVRLIGIAQAYLTSYSIQDLRCNKCGLVRSDNLQPHCDCSGSWGLMTTRKETVSKLTTLSGIAKFHSLHLLEGVVEAIMATL